MFKLNEWADETIIGLAMVSFAMFSLIVLSAQVGQILLGFGLIYLIAVNASKGKSFGKGYAWQIVRTNKDMLEALGVTVVGFFAFTVISDILMGQVPFWFGSSIGLYSSALQPIITINTPVIQFLIWGILIPVLENCFFIGVIGYIIGIRFLGLSNLNSWSKVTTNLSAWVATLTVGAIAATFHFISQLVAPELLFMDVVLFGTGMFIALRYNVLKHGIGIHIMLNAIAMGIRIGWF